jgi:Flp pilus assembly protein TadG
MSSIEARVLRRREDAQILALFAVALVVLAGLVGIVLDGGNVYVQRRTAQAAADAAALAGTRELRQTPAAAIQGGSGTSNTLAGAVCTYAQANSFGIATTVTSAYFVGTDGTTSVGSIPILTNCSTPTSTTVPATASGVHVDVEIGPFGPYLLGVLGIPPITVQGHGTAQVGVLTVMNPSNVPFIMCGGGPGSSGAAEQLLTRDGVTPAGPVVSNSGSNPPTLLTPYSGGTPLPQSRNGGSQQPWDFRQPADTQADSTLLIASGLPSPAPPLALNPAADNKVYYMKGQQISSSNLGNCATGSSSFKGGAAPDQPTNPVQVPSTMFGDNGNRVPQISQRVATSGACPAGSQSQLEVAGGHGCVMILPVANGPAASPPAPPGEVALSVQAWGAFYVWCIGDTGNDCQEYAAQYLSNWPIAGGPSANAWTFGQQGGVTTIRLTQ